MTEKKRELIKTIAVIPSNLEHIAKTGIINGTLLVEIERVMEAYAAQQSKMAPESIAEGKVLMYGNIIVDSIMLPDGIYGTKLPRLYPFDETIEHMIETGKMFRDKTGTEWLPDSYFDNLTKCELRDVVVVFQEQQSKMLAEHDIEAMAKCLHHYINVKEVNQYDTLIFGAMRDYADDFANRQQSKMPTEEEIDKAAYLYAQMPVSDKDGCETEFDGEIANAFADGVEWLRNQIG